MKSPRTFPPFSENRFLSGWDSGRFIQFMAQNQAGLDLSCPGFRAIFPYGC